MSLIIASAIALPVGILSAVKRGTTLDQSVLSFSMFTSSVPSFWLGLLLMQVFLGEAGLAARGRLRRRTPRWRRGCRT